MKKKLFSALCMVATAILLTGCSSAQPDKSNDDTKQEVMTEHESSTYTVTDARGEVEIPTNPQRIVDLSGNSDILSILGYSVVGTANSDAYDYTKFPTYLEDTLKDAVKDKTSSSKSSEKKDKSKSKDNKKRIKIEDIDY